MQSLSSHLHFLLRLRLPFRCFTSVDQTSIHAAFMCKIPSEQYRAPVDFTIRLLAPVVLPIPQQPERPHTPPSSYLAPEGCTSLSEALVDFEGYLLDDSGEQARYAYLQELADLRRDAELVEQNRLQTQAALAEEARSQDGSMLAAAMRQVQDRMEAARNGWLSEEESELDSE